LAQVQTHRVATPTSTPMPPVTLAHSLQILTHSSTATAATILIEIFPVIDVDRKTGVSRTGPAPE
jgi:hypothetical protein